MVACLHDKLCVSLCVSVWPRPFLGTHTRPETSKLGMTRITGKAIPNLENID